MRLRRVKLGGFKSFVDPTVVSLPSNLVGVVGPNGCGKSNIIDAVRWVMGESSARNLRGDSMADVIFSGSSGRKPVGRAFVELVFDNSDGSAPGPYAGLPEITIRREVSRDGLSEYEINKAKCRRKDITDLFLGTGLGPRSYSIIEQGMVTRIIEGKAEDMRSFVEEAAGISKYKERRRETENRIRHTRENLERVQDIRSELDTQLQRLKRQSRAAARYKELKAEERLVNAQLLVLRWQEMAGDVAREEGTLRDLETRLEGQRSAMRAVEADMEKQRVARHDAQEAFNTVQGRYYAVGAEIASAEQAIELARETRRQRAEELGKLELTLEGSSRQLDEDRHRLTDLQAQLAGHEPGAREAEERFAAARAALEQAEAALTDFQSRFDGFQREAAEPEKAREVQSARIAQLEQSQARLAERQARLGEERAALVRTLETDELREARTRTDSLREAIAQQQDELRDLEQRLAEARRLYEESSAELEPLAAELHALDARLQSLREVQSAELGADDEAIATLLSSHGLDAQARLARGVEVEAGWERALERVLGPLLSAVCVADLDAAASALAPGNDLRLSLVETDAAADDAPPDSLAAKVRATDVRVDGLLRHVFVADSLVAALARRPRLAGHEWIVTREGQLVGRHWLSLGGGAGGGLLVRAHEIEELAARREELAARVGELRASTGRHESSAESLADEALEGRRTLQRLTHEHGEAASRSSAFDARHGELNARLARLDAELGELHELAQREGAELDAARRGRETAHAQAQAHSERRGQWDTERAALLAAVEQARARAESARETRHQAELARQAASNGVMAVTETIRRLEAQMQGLTERRDELAATLADDGRPEQALRERLERLLRDQVEAEQRLAVARKSVEEADARVRECELARTGHEQEMEESRTLVEQARMTHRELLVRQENVAEQVRATGYELDAVRADLPAEASEADWHERLQALVRRIERIGPVNLVAIEEYEQQSERKEYLDRQYEDLVRALETLESAMRKIDRETRTRFKETFDQLNASFQNFFPRLFGGGHAYLELTQDDLLSAGVVVMARPPGKRNSTIHLLSGGEKALTAVSLLFSFFDLNPAPFCLLDEVDAPLDDANVERYADVLRTLAQRSQMIFITHNKITMEAADVLLGVTMGEPGVSRLVAVDVVQAVELAAQ